MSEFQPPEDTGHDEYVREMQAEAHWEKQLAEAYAEGRKDQLEEDEKTIKRGERPRPWVRFYVWQSYYEICSGWRSVGPADSTDCTEMNDEEFETFMAALRSKMSDAIAHDTERG